MFGTAGDGWVARMRYRRDLASRLVMWTMWRAKGKVRNDGVGKAGDFITSAAQLEGVLRLTAQPFFVSKLVRQTEPRKKAAWAASLGCGGEGCNTSTAAGGSDFGMYFGSLLFFFFFCPSPTTQRGLEQWRV